MPNSPTNRVALIVGSAIRLTAMERLHGRLMRAPDHDAGTAAPAAPSGNDPAAPAAAAPAGDPPADPANPAPPGEDAGETSLLGNAAAKAGDGDPPADPNAPADPAAKPDQAATEHVVPEAYELSVEGMELDPAAIEEATPFFKEAGLSNDQANKIMPAAAKFRDNVANQTLQQIVDAGAKQRADWADAAKSDPDIGGAKLEESLHLSAKALDALGYPEGSDFRKVLTETGFGNHPEMVRTFRRIGEMVSEDGFPRPGATPATPLSTEKRLYPDD